MYRVLALDLDDTLLHRDGTVTDQTVELLQRWRDLGHYLVVATGRPPRNVTDALPGPLRDVPWICYNGAEVRQDGRSLFRDLLHPAGARALVAWGSETLIGWRIGVEIEDVLYLNSRLSQVKEYVYTEDLLSVCAQPAAKVIFSRGALNGDDTADAGGELFAPLNPILAALPAGTRPILSQRYRLAQFMSSTADKAVALQWVVERWGLTMEQVVAVGDDVNDVDMLRTAGLGVAVANAVPDVLAVADRVTLSNEENGVAELLAELLAVAAAG